MGPILWEYIADTPTLSKRVISSGQILNLRDNYLSLHCSLFPFVFKEFPPSDEELDAYRNGEVC